MKPSFDIKLQLARQALQAGREDQAEAMIRQVLALDPAHAGASSTLAILYARRRDFEGALATLEKAIEAHTERADLLTQAAHLCRDWGDAVTAKNYFRKAAGLNEQDTARNLLDLATTSKYQTRDDDVALIENTYERTLPGSVDRRLLSFALGKVNDDLGNYAKAFEFYREGNSIAADGVDFSLDLIGETFRSIMQTMDRKFFARYARAGVADQVPIFITGMPRSGTTLVEQILASHAEVQGAGELGWMPGIVNGICVEQSVSFPTGFADLDPAVYHDRGGNYVRKLEALSGGRPRVTDKSISSFIYTGLIRAMLPQAKIIICRRDPRDVGLSIFQMDFGEPYPWSFDLEWIGAYTRYFNELIEHWNRTLPGSIHTLQYESLVRSPESQIHSLLEYCGLEFDPACLDFHATRRDVRTASHDQVRRPIYSDSIGRWRNYADQLEPLIRALED